MRLPPYSSSLDFTSLSTLRWTEVSSPTPSHTRELRNRVKTLPSGAVPVIPLPLFQKCIIDIEQFWTFVQSSLFLAFGNRSTTVIDPPPFLEFNHLSVSLDITVFVLVVIQILLFKPLHRGVDVPSILDVVGRDSAIYFVVIASSHFVVVVLFAVARVRSVAQVLEFNPC